MTTAGGVLRLAWIGLATLLVGACSDADLVRDAHPSTLQATAWRAVEVNGRATVAGGEPTLAFTSTDIRGTTGCNQFFGTYTYHPSSGDIDINVTAMTAAACADRARGDIEAAYTQGLDRVSSASVDREGRLLLSGPGVEIILVVDAVPAPSPNR